MAEEKTTNATSDNATSGDATSGDATSGYAVAYTGESGMLCQEAVAYNEGAGARLTTGKVLEGMSEQEARRFLATQAFSPASAETEKLYEAMKGEHAKRINGSVVAAMEVEAASAPRNLAKMRKADLVDMAEEIGLTVEADDTVAKIIEKIRASENPDEDFDPVVDTGEESGVRTPEGEASGEANGEASGEEGGS